MSQTAEPRVENAAEQYERYWVPVVHGPFAAGLEERDPATARQAGTRRRL
jgi:hypothetical protein